MLREKKTTGVSDVFGESLLSMATRKKFCKQRKSSESRDNENRGKYYSRETEERSGIKRVVKLMKFKVNMRVL